MKDGFSGVLASHRQRGAAGMEYLVVCFFAAVVLFGSYDGGDSVVVRLAKSIAGYFSALTYMISLP